MAIGIADGLSDQLAAMGVGRHRHRISAVVFDLPEDFRVDHTVRIQVQLISVATWHFRNIIGI
ncbi:hypothetical protein EHF36_07535 [Kerstersia gyiorum]|uniref:hypothetical protein n=1 Tax=Kerstersia gyiorum TaxID=206506 RepID=UPI0010709013|nr:hypothetical protein [Kerstersia gyiorum]QBR40496.1 hypothetical protein EHF36_07535 [Kerstersia gyiorum]